LREEDFLEGKEKKKKKKGRSKTYKKEKNSDEETGERKRIPERGKKKT